MTPRNPTVAWFSGLTFGVILTTYPDLTTGNFVAICALIGCSGAFADVAVEALTPPAERAKAASWRWFRAWALRRLG